MLVVAKDLQTQYEKALDSASISRELRPQFRKWLRFYLDFCSNSSLPLFVATLPSKNQPEAKRSEASVTVTLCFKMADTGKANALSESKTEADRACSPGAEPAGRRRSLRPVKRREIIPLTFTYFAKEVARNLSSPSS